MATKEYAAQWGRYLGPVWRYQVGGLPYEWHGYCLFKYRAKRQAMRVYDCKKCNQMRWNYYEGYAMPCHYCRPIAFGKLNGH